MRLLTILVATLLLAGAKPPGRIATGTVGADEIVIELLKRSNSLERLIAVSVFSDDPRYSNLKSKDIPPTVKGRVGGEPEALVALKPDLVILAQYNRPELIQLLQNLGIKTLVQRHFDSLRNIEDNILEIGTAIGSTAVAKALVAEMALEPLSATKAGPKPTALLFSLTGQIVGADTVLDDCIKRAGGQNLAVSLGVKGWQTIQAEALIPLDPDFLIASGTEDERQRIVAQINTTPGFKGIAAKKRYKLLLVPAPMITAVSHHILPVITQLRAAFAESGATPLTPSEKSLRR